MVDTKINAHLGLREAMPSDGWLKTIRNVLGLTAAQLAKKIGAKKADSILHFERREVMKSATLASIDRAARAMNCRLVWAIVPEPGYNSLSEIVETRAKKFAAKLLKTVDQTMKLEAQGVPFENFKQQVEELAMELIRNGDPRIWELLDEESNG